jgi:hypothetical protein
MMKRDRSQSVLDDTIRLTDAKREKRSDTKLGVLKIKAASPNEHNIQVGAALYSKSAHLKLWSTASKALCYVCTFFLDRV